MSPVHREETLDGPQALRRVVSRRMLFFFVLGDILGGGIYALVGPVSAEVGGAIWTSFLVALLLAALTAGSYVELATKYPRAGGAAFYAKQAFGSPLVAFLVAFAVVASGVTSAGALSRAFGGDYLAEFVSLPTAAAALAFIAVVAVVNFIGILASVRINVILTLVELGGLLLVVIVGVAALADGQGEPSRAFELKEGAAPILAILAGAALAFYALIGFEDVRIGPLSVSSKVFSAIGLMALANGALINMIMASRLLYGMAREEVLPRSLGYLSRRGTPVVSIAFTTLIAVGLILTGDLGTLADTTVVLLLAVFVVVNVSALLLRKEEVSHDHFEVPPLLPVGGIAACLLVMTQVEGGTWLRAGALLLLGLAMWLGQRTVR